MRSVSAAIAMAVVAVLITAWPASAGTTGAARRAASGESSYPISSSLPANLQAFLRLEISPYLFNIDHHYGTLTPGPDGAYLDNKNAKPGGPWAIEDQRYAAVDVFYGVLHDDIVEVQNGLQMLDYGFSREAADGSFPDSVGLFHGTAMFLAAAGPSLLLLQNWNLLGSIPAFTDGHTVTWMIGRADAAGRYLVKAWWAKPKHIDDSGKEERLFEGALALDAVGVLASDATLEDNSVVYAREGMAMTVMSGPDKGVWTEHGIEKSPCCYDASYQAIGLQYGARYQALLPAGSSLYTSLMANLKLGMQWEMSRTRADGTIITTGDDRTQDGSVCHERDSNGICKTMDSVAVADALMRWGVIAKEGVSGSFIRRAYVIAQRNFVAQGNKLPPPGMSVTPASRTSGQVKYGMPMFASAAGLQPYEPVKVYFGSSLVGSTTTSLTGAFGLVSGSWSSDVSQIKFVPPTTEPGTYTVTAKGAFGGSESTTVQITN